MHQDENVYFSLKQQPLFSLWSEQTLPPPPHVDRTRTLKISHFDRWGSLFYQTTLPPGQTSTIYYDKIKKIQDNLPGLRYTHWHYWYVKKLINRLEHTWKCMINLVNRRPTQQTILICIRVKMRNEFHTCYNVGIVTMRAVRSLTTWTFCTWRFCSCLISLAHALMI